MNELEERAAIVKWLESPEGEEWSHELHRIPAALSYRRLRSLAVPAGLSWESVAFASIEWDHCCDRVSRTICIPSKGRFYMAKAYVSAASGEPERILEQWGWADKDMADIPKGLSSPA